MVYPSGELLTKLLRILGRKINLIRDAIKAELDGLVCSDFAVNIINELHGDFFSHGEVPFRECH